MSNTYPFSLVEGQWQSFWDAQNSFVALQDSPKPKYYVLEMFPYPSGRIHMGHVRNYALGDVIARFRRAQGFNVLHPMGWDAFGLPAENAALERGVHPKQWTLENIAAMKTQLKRMGLSYDWTRELATCLPSYYGHEQKLFLDFLKQGLAYRKESLVNWDPVENTVLANEQVVDGKGWRSGAVVEKKQLTQWFLKITDYADDLLEALDHLPAWPERLKTMQVNWIGKSQGMNIRFALAQEWAGTSEIQIYTTRPETLFGAAFIGISPNHPLAGQIGAQNPEALAFIKECQAGGTSEAELEKAEKRGFDTGLRVVHPFDAQRQLPLYIANFVLMDYGTGAIFGCPAHDARDFAFARKYHLPILPVIAPFEGESNADEPFEGPGRMIHSDFLNGLETAAAAESVMTRLESLGVGTRRTNFRLRDWGVSRQRYWGCPIPIIHCAACGPVPVPEKDLPVIAPEDVSFDQPGNPLFHHPTWKHVSCPTCGGAAERETDTFDTFFESSWYFARFCCPDATQPLDPEALRKWLPVDQYIGGIEHAVMHLLYARFFTRALSKCGYTDIQEPFEAQMPQGMVCHRTFKDPEGRWVYPDEVHFEGDQPLRISDNAPLTIGRSEKMSKSKRNVVDPQEIFDAYGADTARLFMMSDSPPERDLEWSEAGLQGAWRYLNRLWRLGEKMQEHLAAAPKSGTADTQVRRTLHQTIAACTQDIGRFAFNKYVARVREFTNTFENAQENLSAATLREGLSVLLQLLNPVVPHITEEMWKRMGETRSLVDYPWPVADPELLAHDTVTLAVQVNGKLRATIVVDAQWTADQIQEAALSHEAVARLVGDQPVRKVIVVPGKIVNVVV